MPGRLAEKCVLITGATSGIGRAATDMIVAEGGCIVIADTDQKAGQTFADKLGGAARFVRCDMTSESDVTQLVDAAVRHLGQLYALVNNAGMIVHKDVAEVPPELWEQAFAVNARSTFLLIKLATQHLKAAGGASIINMASMAVLRGAPGLAVYSASKATVIGLSTALALELAPTEIRVNAICPGWVETSFNEPVIDALIGPEAQEQAIMSSIPQRRQGTVAEIAALIVYLASDEPAFITAQAISINGGAYN